MTENKRFKLGYVCGDFGLIDNDEWIDLHSMSENSEKNVRICINKMNELSEENEQLKSIKKFADRNGICIFNIDEAFSRCWQDNAKLVKENKQLKSDLDYFQKTYEIEERGLDIVAPMCTIGSPTPSRLELFKENEQLKQAYTQLKHRHSLLHDECLDAECDRDSYQKDVSSLEKENEQLKSELSKKDIQLDFLKDENKHMRELVNENEQLKQRIKEVLS